MNSPNLGYFLSFKYWINALNLLKYQLDAKKTNKHFNTLSLFYYEKVIEIAKHLELQDYFETRVANNLFYGLKTEFTVIPYTIPKSDLGVRKYKFFTLPMRILYYAISLYLVDLSQVFITEYYRKFDPRIFSRYGGNLRFKNREEIVLSYDSIWYKPHYRAFRKEVIQETKVKTGDKVIIHLDVQNYYDEIDMSILLRLLEHYVKPSRLRHLKFDVVAQNQIEAFFSFIENNKVGIPQSDNDIVSSYIGWLYLVFSDLLIEQEIQRISGLLAEHRIIRYVDDYYILLTFMPNTAQFDKERLVNDLTAHIADMLYLKFGLRLNTKTKLYWLSDKSVRDDLLNNLKRVSPGYEIPDDESGEHPKEKINRIFTQLRKLKKAPLDPSFSFRRDLDTEVLKDIYIDEVKNLLAEPNFIRRTEKIFTGFNFDLVIAQPREIIILLLYSKSAAKEFQEYLLAKPRLSSRDAYLILSYLCQTNFQSLELIRKLKSYDQFATIMEIFEQGEIYSMSPGYFDLDASQILQIAKMPNVIEQIRLRMFAEQKQQYSVALNHLLNEIHSLSWTLDSLDIDEHRYKVQHVLQFLDRKAVPHEIRIKIRNLFDRRNKNPVSHADTAAWPVSESEYLDYREQVGKCLAYIL